LRAARQDLDAAVEASDGVATEVAGLAAIMPGLGTTRWPLSTATSIGRRNLIRRSVPSPAFHRPLPPEPLRMWKSSSTTGKRHHGSAEPASTSTSSLFAFTLSYDANWTTKEK
jgi:hypothetical protein